MKAGIQSRNLASRQWLYGLLFASPWLLGFSILTVYPVAKAFYYSFTDYDVLSPPIWVGIANYQEIVQDDLFWKSLWNTFFYTALAVPISLVISLGLALLVNRKLPGIEIYRTAFFLPSVTPIVAFSILWIWLLHPGFGLINWLLSLVGLNGLGWLSDPRWSKPAIILMAQWGTGATMLIFLGGLQTIPKQLYEAAEIDGASLWRRFIHVTLPMLSPTILLNLILQTIFSLQIFTQGFIMTGGGPLDSTLFYVLYLFRNAFTYFRMGYAAALGVVLFVITVAISLTIWLTQARWVYYEVENR
ncbi:MAG: carbohydrate ABC transporter permease [Candidatus Bipolaricaulia bacterium]